jgi:hypothetical protein
MDRLLAYSLSLPDRSGSTDAVWRFGASISTLRARNRDVAVVVFVFGDVPLELALLRATDDDVLRALPLPSAGQRLLVEVAWWLTLGHVTGLTTDDFAARHVAVGHEVAMPCAGDDWVIAHYAADGTGRPAWLHERAASLAG